MSRRSLDGSQFEVVPLAEADLLELERLLEEEVCAWKESLEWDYRRTARLIREYASAGMVPGVALNRHGHLVGYGYYLLREDLGSIGGIFESAVRTDSIAAGLRIFSDILGRLMADPGCRRIEGQLFTLTHPWDGILEQQGLRPEQRFYMARCLTEETAKSPAGMRPWENDALSTAARLLFLTYECHADARISVMYQSVRGCVEFLRNLVLLPGCGDFLGHASALFMDRLGDLGGFVLATRIGPHAALVPQICVRPDLQGRGIGGALLEHTCACLHRSGFRKVFLCVTGANEPARRLYLKHRFQDVQGFSAFFWNRGAAGHGT